MRSTIDYDRGICTIYNGYEVHDPSVMMTFIMTNLRTPPFDRRTPLSYFSEWRAHNLLYEMGIEPDRTATVDLDLFESAANKLLYFILSIFYI